MTTETNFEAHGRYSVAKKAALQLVRQRNVALADMARMAKEATSGCGDVILGSPVPLTRLRERLAEVETLDADLQRQIAQANSVAADCGEPALSLR